MAVIFVVLFGAIAIIAVKVLVACVMAFPAMWTFNVIADAFGWSHLNWGQAVCVLIFASIVGAFMDTSNGSKKSE